ncbi:MAG: hypothetical protein ACLPX8_07380 [Bryobacteraceae bacterium]|jgi:uncharacterized protein (TIGR03437 family)
MKKSRYALIRFGLLAAVSSFACRSQQYTVSTIAGDGTAGYTGDAGPAGGGQSELSSPTHVLFQSGSLYISDSANYRIRVISGGNINTYVGNGTEGYSGDAGQPSSTGQATSAEIAQPAGMCIDAQGQLYLADAANHVIRKVSPGGIIVTIAGVGSAGYNGDGGVATSAQLNSPLDVAVDAAANVYIADAGNNVIRQIDVHNGYINTIIGTGGTSNTLNHPVALTLDSAGNIYISDAGNHRIAKYSAGVVTTYAGNTVDGYSGDGGPATAAEISNPQQLVFDAAGNLYFADSTNGRIRMVTPGGIITTVAGNGAAAYTGDGGPATLASLFIPQGVAVDPAGNVYVGDTQNDAIREVSPAYPGITTGGVVNGASYAPQLAPGSLASIFVSNLPPVTATSSSPFSTTYQNVSLTVNGVSAPILGVYGAANQVNFQVPYETKTGAATIVVTVSGFTSNTVTVTVTATAPGLFLVGTAPAVQNFPAYTLNSSSNRVAAGGAIIAYLTGSGAVSPAVADGAAAPASTLTYTTITPTATIGTAAAQVTFSGLAPGFVGLTQVDITVPSSLTTGSYPLVITYAGQSTVAGTIWVQ